MPTCTLHYDSTGTDTAASGTQAPSTAVTDASTGQTISVATSTTHTFSAAVDLTGVADDGTDVIWINTATGNRHLFRITSFTGGVAACTAIVTVEAATNTAGTLAWGVGGTRATLDNDTGQPDPEDWVNGWRILLGDGASYTPATASLPLVPATVVTLADGPLIIEAESGTNPLIVLNNDGSNAGALFAPDTDSQVDFIGIDMQVTGSSWVGNRLIYIANADDVRLRMFDCDLDGNALGVPVDVQDQATMLFVDCVVHDSVADNFTISGGRAFIHAIGCEVYGAAERGFDLYNGQTLYSSVIENCIVRNNTMQGIRERVDAVSGKTCMIKNCVIHQNTSHGIQFEAAWTASGHSAYVFNNIITSNGGYGVFSVNTSTLLPPAYCDYNAFHNNTSGETLRILNGTNNITLTADPYTDESTEDFTLNETAGGGAACRGAGLE